MPRLKRKEWLSVVLLSVLAVGVVVSGLLGQTAWSLAALGVLLAASAVVIVLAIRYWAMDAARSQEQRTEIGRLTAEHATFREAEQEAARTLGKLLELVEKSQLQIEQMASAAESGADAHNTRIDQLESSVGLVAKGVDASRDAVAELDRLVRSAEWQVRRLHPDLLTDLQAMHQLFERFSVGSPLPPVGGWAMSPCGILMLVDLIDRRGLKTIVECGSGTSTLWMAMALRNRGEGKVWALEHEPRFAARTRQLLEAHGLTEWAAVSVGPVAPTETPRGTFEWYGIDPPVADRPIDLLVVDGPPHLTGRHARYPAFPLFRSHLASGAVIVADDTTRTDEQEMIEFWQQEEPRLRPLASPYPGCEVLELGEPEPPSPSTGRASTEGVVG